MEQPSPLSETPVAKPSTLPARLINIFATPGEVFDEIKNAPVQTGNWLVPVILLVVMAMIYVMAAFSQEGVLQTMRENSEKVLQKNVASGKMTQAQADQAKAGMEKFMTPSIMEIFGCFGAVMTVGCEIFLLSVILWPVARQVRKGEVTYMKMVEVVSMTSMIDVLQKIVRSFLVVWKENLLATVSPTFFVENASMTNKTHVFLSMFDLIDLWWLGVLALGISKIGSISYAKSALWIFGIWFALRLVGVAFIRS